MASEFDIQKVRNNLKENRNFLKTFRDRAQEAGVSDRLSRIPRFTEGELVRKRAENRHLRAYMTQLMNNIQKQVESAVTVFALVDPEGCIYKMNGSPELLRFLESKGIALGASWQLKRLGPNAITVGLTTGRSSMSVGEENYQQILQDLGIYYSPMLLEFSSENGGEPEKNDFGGLAIFTRREDASPIILAMASAVASSLMIRIHMAWRTSEAYESDAAGMALLDINVKNKAVSVTHHNNAFFDVLGIPRETKRSVYFKSAEYYFDPLPVNRSFWELINKQQVVKEREMTVYAQGKAKDLILSTTPVKSQGLSSASVMLQFTSRAAHTRKIADMSANNAVVTFDNIIGECDEMKNRIKRARLFAGTDSNVMLMGESGVGKDVFAQAIHNASARSDGPFIAINCGAIPRDLIASELFGYDAGAFTGAKKQGNIGKFELANGGTLFLDEIGEMPLDLQATLLRAVEQKSFMRIGGSKTIQADVKIISATNVDIMKMIDEKKFRADLYYRLCTMSLYIPPLRERGNDIVLLAEYFIRTISNKIGKEEIMTLDEDVKEFLVRCPWRGNVREVQNLIECLVELYPDPRITMEMVKENINPAYYEYLEAAEARTENLKKQAADDTYLKASAPPLPRMTPVKPREVLTREEILKALDACGGNRSKAADFLGVGRRTLYRYMEKAGIENK